jgi:carboxyl-terminal processing protease
MSKGFGIVAAAIFISATIVGGTFGGTAKRSFLTKGEASVAEQIEGAYRSAMTEVSANYAGEVDYEKATQAAIQGMLQTLDPHSMFFSPDEFKKLREDQNSRFYGIGVSILRHRDGVYIQSTVPDTPAARQGLRYGDRILEVDGKDAREWTGDQVSKQVRGERGETVTLKIERAGQKEPLYFNIVRDEVPLPSIGNAYMIKGGTGYIGLTRGFQHDTGEDLRAAIKNLKAQGMRQLILDLRNNPGGLLDQANEVASEFLPRGKTIVSVRGREYNQPVVYRSTGTDPEDFPLVVLINRNSASASEIVAGAIQDHGRGLVVGETSFGKALVQRVYQLPYGAGLTLTTAKYYTPYGRSIQRDYSNGSFYDYYTRHSADEDTPPHTPTTKTSPSPSPTVAQPTPTPTPPPGPPVKTAAGRVFYDGGGVTPDYEVKPLAATALRLRIVETAFHFTRELVAGQVPGLENYRVEKPDFAHALRPTDYPITDRIVEAFRNFVRRDPTFGIQPAQVDEELDFIRLRVRDEIVTAAFNADSGARVLIESDPQVLRAVELLPDAKRLVESVRNAASIS